MSKHKLKGVLLALLLIGIGYAFGSGGIATPAVAQIGSSAKGWIAVSIPEGGAAAFFDTDLGYGKRTIYVVRADGSLRLAGN